MADYAIEYMKSAVKELEKLPRDVARRIVESIEELAIDPLPAGVKALQGEKGAYRIRIGEYRVVYELVRKRLVVLVVKIGHRREVYR